MIYLDNAATTWPKPAEVYEAVDECLRNVGGSPGRGGHNRAMAAGYILYEAREALAGLLRVADPTTIAFFYNATDAINTALLGTLRPGDSVVTTSMEHNAVSRPLRYLEQAGVRVHIAKCLPTGEIDMPAIERLIKKGVTAVVMSHASNVTGTLMPVREVGVLARQYQACFIVDGAQTVGVEEIDVEEMGIDILGFSGHKGLLGPQGTGGLYVRPTCKVMPLRYGGTGSLSESDVQPQFMPDCLESGTPNTPGIAGLLAGVKYIVRTGRDVIRKRETNLAQQLTAGLEKIKGVTIYGPQNPSKKTAVVSFTIHRTDSAEVAHCLDKRFGIASRSGLHCAPWAHQTIGTLKTGTVRLSPGFFNTEAEMEETVEAIKSIAEGRV